MALSFASYTATGTSGDFNIPFPYFNVEHLEVRVNNVITGFTLLTSSLLRITPTPTAGSVVSVRRQTPPDLAVAAKDLPTFIRYLAEESRDLVYSFDSLYGDIFYDVSFTVQDGSASTDIVGVVNPNLNVSLRDESTVVADVAPTAGSVNLSIEAVSEANVVTPLATATVANGSVRGVVTVGSTSAVPSGSIIRVRQTSTTAFSAVTLLLRFKRN